MKNRPTRLCPVFLLVLLLLSLVGCGQDAVSDTAADVNVISIGVFQDSMTASATEKMVALFNEAQTDVQAEIVYFPDADHMNLSFVTGEQPDIINFDGYTMSDELYAHKGYLCDLYPYLDADAGRTSLVASYLTCAEQDGKLYSLATEFQCRTLVAPTDVVGTDPGWTLTEFAEVLRDLPEGMDVMAYMTKSTFLQLIIEQTISEFVSYSDGTCDFACQDFYDLLTICDQYFPVSDAQAGQGSIAENTAFLETVYSLGGFSGLVNAFAAYNCSVPVTAMGYPSAEGNGAVLYWYNSFGITSGSGNQDAAWKFISWAISDAYQEQVFMAIPVSQSQLDKTVQALREDETVDQQALEQALDLLNGATTKTLYQSALVDIVTEEAATFFAQDQSVEHVVAVIQDRAETYLAEIS
jgi:ABC-type glycerol-3-phosphate transport system substrate-binding protein